MSKIIIEYDSEDLKAILTGIVASKLYSTIIPGSRKKILFDAQKQAQQMMADKIMKELEQA